MEIDTEIGAAYVQLSQATVARTEEYSEEINVDLDGLGMVVGIELLDTAVPVPLDELAVKYHIKTTTLARLLAAIQPATAPAVVSVSAVGSPEIPLGEYQTIAPKPVTDPSSQAQAV
ncbi:MAG: DUF2283 domain-containing protein [Actinomycetota bacterium]|nr:DUF2283 domain-containing protein [Actinomycetota bacterium]